MLFGAYNPGGRLPITVYQSVEQLPPYEDYAMRERTYRFFTGEPLYPFGYGLSYTRFVYSNLRTSAPLSSADMPLTVSVEVQNVGARAGDEVAQLYLSDLAASVPVPLRQLQGFNRLHLAPGEKQTVTFTLQPEQFAVTGEDGQRVVEPGAFRIAVGGVQPGQRQRSEMESNVLETVIEIKA